MIKHLVLSGLLPLFLLSACTPPPAPPKPPPPRDFSRPDPDKLLSEMTAPYEQYKWVETVLVYQLDDVPQGKIPARAQLEQAAGRVDKRLGQFKVMRRVVVHERWVAVGLGGVTQAKLDRIRGYLDCRQSLSLSLLKSDEAYIRRLASGVDPATGVKVIRKGTELFFLATGLSNLHRALNAIPTDLRLPPELWMAIGPHSEAQQTNSGYRTYLLQAPPWVDVSDLASVQVIKGRVADNGDHIVPRIELAFSPGAALRMARLSGEFKGGRTAVVLAGRVYSPPQARGHIKSGRLSLTVDYPAGYPLVQEERALDLTRELRAMAGMPRVSLEGLYGIQPIAH